MRVVIAEDERLIALGLKTILRRLGHEVCAMYPSAEQCIDQAPQFEPDLVFMDIRMEGQMDGIEAASVLREKYDIPVVFTTAYDDPETRSRAAQVHPIAFLRKPIGADCIASTLSTIV